MTFAGPRLSPREKECLRLVPELRSSKAIAQRLGLTPNTANEYIKSAMKKLGASDRYEAARLAAGLGGETCTPPTMGGFPAREVGGWASAVPKTSGRQEPAPEPAALHEEVFPFSAWPSDQEGIGDGLQLRQEGDRNVLSARQRLARYVFYGTIVLLAFLGFCAGLLVLTVVLRELHTH